MNNDRPFNQQIEKDNPWFSDPSYRIINRNVSQRDVACFHLHVDTSYFNQDFNCLLPVHRLLELEEEGFIGGTAQSHYSYIGYTLLPDPLLNGSVPLIIENLERENVDVAILIPSWPLCPWSVGLVQRAIEAAGFVTIAVSNIPALSLSVSSPRIAAIEFPLSQTIGRPGDTLGQAAVLRASLQAIEGIDQPGGLVHLPFDWSEDTRENKSPALQPPPITRYLKSHPWDLPKFMSRQVPEKYRSAP